MYDSKSPWYKTPVIQGKFLDIMKKRTIFKDPTDEEYTIEPKYNLRPDLFSYDRYGTAKYWWMFAMRNPDLIVDPINDFVSGKVIRVPSQENIERMK